MLKLFPLLLVLASCQDYNSNTSDRSKYGPVELEANPQFQRAYGIIQQRCTSCHTSPVHSGWGTYTTSQMWIDTGRVVAGDSQNSPLVRRIWNSGNTDSNMPQGQGPLANDEYDAIVEWIDNL
jgi:uncharacterized membrane protein